MSDVEVSEVVEESAASTIEISPARAREALLEAAQELQRRLGRTPNAKERVWFCLEAFEDDLFVRGESSPLLAEVWGLHPNTVERSAATAAQMLEDPGNVDRARTEVTTRALRRSDEVYQRAQLAQDREAAGLYAASNQSLDLYGKATGAISNTTQVGIVIVGKDGSPQLRPEVRQLVDASQDQFLAAQRAAVAELAESFPGLEEAFDEAFERQARALSTTGGG